MRNGLCALSVMEAKFTRVEEPSTKRTVTAPSRAIASLVSLFKKAKVGRSARKVIC